MFQVQWTTSGIILYANANMYNLIFSSPDLIQLQELMNIYRMVYIEDGISNEKKADSLL